jgi:site-specific recombinase XerD
MSKLREQFRQHMRLRGLADRTQDSYEHAMVQLAKAYGTSPDKMTNEQIQMYLDRLIRERHLSWNTVNVYFSACRCFYVSMLQRTGTEFSLPPRGRSHHKPVVLSRDAVRRILTALENLKHRALLIMAYGSGLRVNELVHLKPHHIESAPDRMMVRVEGGKPRESTSPAPDRHDAHVTALPAGDVFAPTAGPPPPCRHPHRGISPPPTPVDPLALPKTALEVTETKLRK